jgi:hypothetical protein
MERLKMTVDVQQILDAISKLSEMIFKLDAKLDVHIAEHIDPSKKVDEMYRLLITGNGAPPIPERLRRIEAYIEATNLEKKALADDKLKWKWILIATTIPLVIAFIAEIVIFYVRIYPMIVGHLGV